MTVPHRHPHAEEVFLVVQGEALFRTGEDERTVGPGNVLMARRGTRHAIGAVGSDPLVLLISMTPNVDRPDETVEEESSALP
jgi:quercetin dioxygenase-like cupin family protein